MNKFRLWLNRNDLKILLVIIFIFMIHILLKGTKNDSIKNDKETVKENENTYLYRNDVVNDKQSENYIQLDQSTEEYQKIVFVTQKIVNSFYQVNVNNDNASLREDIYHMFSDAVIQDLLSQGNTINAEHILEYIFYVDDVKNYAIGQIYKGREENNIAKYAVVLRNKGNERNPIDNYLMLHMDYKNNTFSYEGMVSSLSDVDSSGELCEIRNKGSNCF